MKNNLNLSISEPEEIEIVYYNTFILWMKKTEAQIGPVTHPKSHIKQVRARTCVSNLLVYFFMLYYIYLTFKVPNDTRMNSILYKLILIQLILILTRFSVFVIDFNFTLLTCDL